MEKIDLRRESGVPGYGWTFCGDEYDYGLFDSMRPKEVAKIVINRVFSDKEISERLFVYVPYKYRGKNNLMDRLDVYCCEKYNAEGLKDYIPKERDHDTEWLKSVQIDHFELIK